jgi:hypothetical protein
VVLLADVEGVGVSVAVTVTVIVESLLSTAEFPVELAVAELTVTEVRIVVVNELSPPQSPLSFGSLASIELVVSCPVMPP